MAGLFAIKLQQQQKKKKKLLIFQKMQSETTKHSKPNFKQVIGFIKQMYAEVGDAVPEEKGWNFSLLLKGKPKTRNKGKIKQSMNLNLNRSSSFASIF